MPKKKKLTCHNCGTKFKYKKTGSYPSGPCPALCDKCHSSCCPDCGGKLGRLTGCEDMDLYTAGGCHDCDYACCGGCI